ncbi:uncharacterized mitochondrial protein AtMg00810-like [Aristolochia californica]|uniref:uncharacterized mitochondrial protein AtMg00810-like n=1 Tax=Aristolochia californica TaxID=171875 RepID=UPI0035E33E07
MLRFEFTRSFVDHLVFVKHTKKGVVLLVVYVYAIILMGCDTESINQIKMKMCSEFKTKDLGLLKYFLGIEVLRSKHRSILSQRKYVQYFLKHTRTMGCHPVDTPMDTNVKLCASSGEDVDVVSLVSLYIHKPQVPHWQALERILSHLNVESIADVNWAGSPNYKKSTSRYCILVRGNLVTWKSKKQNVVTRSSAKEEYRAMGHSFMKKLTISKLTITFQREAARILPLGPNSYRLLVWSQINTVIHKKMGEDNEEEEES